jgi:hypothetical protein
MQIQVWIPIVTVCLGALLCAREAHAKDLAPPAQAGSSASPLRAFTAECVEGETHRYDGGSGVDALGEPIAQPRYGWSIERWGDLRISWTGGDSIQVGNLSAHVESAVDGILAASWAGDGPATNVYSLILDTSLGQAVYSQVQAVVTGKSRQIKVRSQNLRCKITHLH